MSKNKWGKTLINLSWNLTVSNSKKMSFSLQRRKMHSPLEPRRFFLSSNLDTWEKNQVYLLFLRILVLLHLFLRKTCDKFHYTFCRLWILRRQSNIFLNNCDFYISSKITRFPLLKPFIKTFSCSRFLRNLRLRRYFNCNCGKVSLKRWLNLISLPSTLYFPGSKIDGSKWMKR